VVRCLRQDAMKSRARRNRNNEFFISKMNFRSAVGGNTQKMISYFSLLTTLIISEFLSCQTHSYTLSYPIQQSLLLADVVK